MSSPAPFGAELPHLITAIPGPRSQALIDSLSAHECPAVTARRARRAATLGQATDDPFVWKRAEGSNVEDVDGNRFVDLTAGFAVATLGHRHPKVVEAAKEQADTLLHAMGDAWPDAARIGLLAALADYAPGDLSVSLLGLSGADAVDAAVKTAVLATGRTGIVSFDGGYHGLALGPLGLQGYKSAFTDPFRDITHGHVTHLPWACDRQTLRATLQQGSYGLIMVEPIQGRGGVRPAPEGWLQMLAEEAQRAGVLLAFDEIQCGLGRTGTPWACDADGVVPDLLCTGKALGGGFPISACIGTPDVMNAWGASKGEALHTQTFLGHPVGCAAALAALTVLRTDAIPQRCAEVGAQLSRGLRDRGYSVRGRGLMLGVELGDISFPVARALQQHGYIVLPAGQRAEVLCLTPPVSLNATQQAGFLDALDQVTKELGVTP